MKKTSPSASPNPKPEPDTARQHRARLLGHLGVAGLLLTVATLLVYPPLALATLALAWLSRVAWCALAYRLPFLTVELLHTAALGIAVSTTLLVLFRLDRTIPAQITHALTGLDAVLVIRPEFALSGGAGLATFVALTLLRLHAPTPPTLDPELHLDV